MRRYWQRRDAVQQLRDIGREAVVLLSVCLVALLLALLSTINSVAMIVVRFATYQFMY